MTRKASLQETADRLAEIKALLRTCLKLEPSWRDKPLKSNKVVRSAREHVRIMPIKYGRIRVI